MEGFSSQGFPLSKCIDFLIEIHSAVAGVVIYGTNSLEILFDLKCGDSIIPFKSGIGPVNPLFSKVLQSYNNIMCTKFVPTELEWTRQQKKPTFPHKSPSFF